MKGLVRVALLLAACPCGEGYMRSASAAPPARRASDIAGAILACWRPPLDGGEITLSLALRRNGSVIGAPRVTYVKTGDRPDADGLRSTILDAVRSCTPIALSAPLQAAIAGQVLRIRFVAVRGDSTGKASVIWTGT